MDMTQPLVTYALTGHTIHLDSLALRNTENCVEVNMKQTLSSISSQMQGIWSTKGNSL
jgi:hypothetical protein